MIIAIDARFYGMEHAGLGRYTINLLKHLQLLDTKNNYNIILKSKYFNRLKLTKNFHKVEGNMPHYSIHEQLIIPRILNRIKPDVFHALHLNIPVFYGGNLITTVHDTTQLSYTKKATTLPTPLYLLKHSALNYTFKTALLKSSKIIVPSRAVRNDLVDIYKAEDKKIEVIYEGVDRIESNRKSDMMPSKYDFDTPYFVYVGNYYPHKNIERTIEAIHYLNEQKNKKVTLVLGGSRGVFQKRLQKIVKKSNADNYVKMIGFVPDEVLGFVFKKSLGFIYPSTSEGFGLQGLEAMNANTLLLASNIPAFKEIYKDNAINFNPYDFTSIAHAMEVVMALKASERKKRINQAKKFVTRYSWRKMAEDTLKVYKDVVK